jgi:Ni/Fe-hydrogenase subunit HybB-like protein
MCLLHPIRGIVMAQSQRKAEDNSEGDMMNKIAYLLIGIGAVVLIIWGVKEFLTDSTIDPLIRIAAAAVGLGVLLLVGIVVRDRVRASKTDKFKGVQR